MMPLDKALDDVMQLDDNSREMLLEILQKRQVGIRRARIAKDAKESLKDFHAGNFTPVTAGEAIKQPGAFC
jgi:hypothetical protein